jgi:exodeoxyribonuclease V alpha subunit
MRPKDTVTLRGELLRFTPRSDDGWGIGTIDVPAAVAAAAGAPDFDTYSTGNAIIEFTGKVAGAKPGTALELQGKWFDHPRYGRQFRVIQCVQDTPQTADGVVRWLAATLPDVGATRAAALLAHFGGDVAALWQAIETSPALLTSVPGITAARAAAISTAYTEHRGTRDSQIALRGWGLTDNQIERCLRRWHTLDAVVTRIRENPYQLARYVEGFGFKRADEVAKAAGVAHDAPQRIEAGIAHVLELASYDGHCFMWGGALQKVAAEVLEVDAALVGRTIRRASAHKLVVRRGKRIYGSAFEALERKCAHAVVRILARSFDTGDQTHGNAGTGSTTATVH